MTSAKISVCKIFFAAILYSTACAGFGQPKGAGLDPVVFDPLATAVTAGAAGEVYLHDSPWGPGTAFIGEQYLSPLGRPCRRAAFTSSTGQKRDLAVCQAENGAWVTAPDISPGTASKPL
ncbi:MAG: hypothetical protein FWG97_03145 [Deltaproteobacteria bacterium]|nr:hypothetical protein [Deltaproteobacteria bacterium]